MGRFHSLIKGSSGGIQQPLWKLVFAEFLGTTLLIFFGCGSLQKLNPEDDRQLVGIALCWGLTLATLIQILGHCSCDVNPAVTLASLATGRINLVKFSAFVISQCVGAIGGIYLLDLVLPPESKTVGQLAVTQLAAGLSPLQGCVIEAMGTFLLVFTIFGSTDGRRRDIKGSAALAIGLCVSAVALFAGLLTGCSLNPARTLGPSLVAGHFEHHWVYWVGPLFGGLVAGLLYHHAFRVRSHQVVVVERVSDVEL